MKPIIIISSTQYPGYGGAATNAYHLIKYFRKLKFKTIGVFFNNITSVNYDPENIGNIYLYKNTYNKIDIFNNIISIVKQNPNICLAKNYLAPIYCKEIFNCFTIYLVSGINHFDTFYNHKNITALDVLNTNFIVNEYIDNEIYANKLVDKIIVNSELTHKIFSKIYNDYVYKLYNRYIDTTLCIKNNSSNYLNNKKYDIILVCSNFKRYVKNNVFLINILNLPIFDKYTKCFVGKNNDMFNNIKNSTFYDIQSQDICLKLMSKSKILLYPSLYDSNPNTVREAYYNKCLPIITKNIGNSELFPDYLICENFEKQIWVNKIINILKNYDKYKDTIINFNKNLNYLELLF